MIVGLVTATEAAANKRCDVSSRDRFAKSRHLVVCSTGCEINRVTIICLKGVIKCITSPFARMCAMGITATFLGNICTVIATRRK